MVELTRIQKRELMWLSTVADASGWPESDAATAKSESMGDGPRADLRSCYEALALAGYVDSLVCAWGGAIVKVRLTAEGRARAEDFLKEELDDPFIPEDVKRKVADAAIGTGVSSAIGFFLRLVGFC